MQNSVLPVISAIIPMYNGGEKIRVCLQKLDQQDIQEPYEVLIVDDASPDGSADKTEEHIRGLSHPERFRLIRCAENGRAGQARNIGVREATGEYIVFLDQDDYPDTGMLKVLYELTENGKFDCTVCDIVDKNGGEYHRYPCGRKETLTPEDRKQAMTQFGYVFAILIRKKIIEENRLHFPEKVMFEDSLYNHGLLSCIDSIHTAEKVLYYRDDDENSQTASLSVKKLRDRVKATEIYLDNFQKSTKIIHYMPIINQYAFYYIYLSCILWMIRDEALYDKELYTHCYRKGHELGIKWDEVYLSQRHFGEKNLKLLKAIYYVPRIGTFLRIKTKTRNALGRIKHWVAG